jgi:hypothetical protein
LHRGTFLGARKHAQARAQAITRVQALRVRGPGAGRWAPAGNARVGPNVVFGFAAERPSSAAGLETWKSPWAALGGDPARAQPRRRVIGSRAPRIVRPGETDTLVGVCYTLEVIDNSDIAGKTRRQRNWRRAPL